MAGDDALTAAGFSAEEREASTEISGKTYTVAKAAEDQLHEAVMERLEALVAKQESALWQHGQEEMAQMQRDHESVWASLQELASQQAVLRDEQAEMSRAMLEISSRLDFVMELNEVVLPGGQEHLPASELVAATASSDGPGVPGSAENLHSPYDDILVDSAGHQLLPPLLLSSVASPVGPDSTAVMNAVCAAAQAAASAAAAAAAVLPVAAAGSFPLAPADTAEGPRTPPRQRPGKVDRDSKSPTILSLASALTSAQTPPPVEPRKRAPSRLNIAAHLLEAPSKPSALPQLRADAPSFVPGAEVC